MTIMHRARHFWNPKREKRQQTIRHKKLFFYQKYSLPGMPVMSICFGHVSEFLCELRNSVKQIGHPDRSPQPEKLALLHLC